MNTELKLQPNRRQVIKVYANPSHNQPDRQASLNPILQAIWNSSPSEEQLRSFRSRQEDFVSVPKAEEADLYLLCLNWNFYVDHGLVSLAAKEAGEARKAKKPLVVFSGGDFTANLRFPGAVLFQSSGYRSRRSVNGTQIFSLPNYFIADYQSVYGQGVADVRQKNPQPIVGFCGQADGSPLDVVRRYIACQLRKCAFKTGLRKWEPPPFETVRWRRRVLDQLAADPCVETRFILRRRYRAGYWVEKKDPFHVTRLELVNNIRDTNYTVCMRGGGNFSVRLYETLCLGRIPVFVDTDCILPYDQVVDWRRYCVWIDSSEVSNISRKVIEFHNALSSEEFMARQQECRRLWQDWLSADGYWSQFWHHFATRPASPL
jgi:hypothetical protein